MGLLLLECPATSAGRCWAQGQPAVGRLCCHACNYGSLNRHLVGSTTSTRGAQRRKLADIKHTSAPRLQGAGSRAGVHHLRPVRAGRRKVTLPSVSGHGSHRGAALVEAWCHERTRVSGHGPHLSWTALAVRCVLQGPDSRRCRHGARRLFHPLCLHYPAVSAAELPGGAWTCPCCGEEQHVRRSSMHGLLAGCCQQLLQPRQPLLPQGAAREGEGDLYCFHEGLLVGWLALCAWGKGAIAAM